MKIPTLLFVLVTFMPLLSWANSRLSPFYIGTGIHLNVLDDKDESIGYEAMLGFHVLEGLALEGGYSDFGVEDIKNKNMAAIFGRVKIRLPISDCASLNFGVGTTYDDSAYDPLISVDAEYQLTNNLSFSISYQSLFGFDEEKRDLESLTLSFVYRFGPEISSQDHDYPSFDEVKIKQKEIMNVDVSSSDTENVTKPLPSSLPPKLKDHPICHDIYMTHVVSKGEDLMHISKVLEISFDKLKILNEKFFEKGRDVNLIYPGELVVYPYLDCDSNQ